MENIFCVFFWLFLVHNESEESYICSSWNASSMFACDVNYVKEFNIKKEDIGALGSTFAISYSISKLVGGIVADFRYFFKIILCIKVLSSTKYLFGFGLLFAGISNIGFGLVQSDQFAYLGIAWFLNGLCQGVAFSPSMRKYVPAFNLCIVARLLTVWFRKEERGTWWAAVSTSQAVGF